MSEIQVSQAQFDAIAKGGVVKITGPKGSVNASIKTPTYTEIAVLLDESGSMGDLKNDTIGGFNTLLEEQQKLPGAARLTVAKFDDEFSFIYENVNLAEAAKITDKDYSPRGSTKLRDSLGRLISSIESRVNALPAEQRPDRVSITIITDGMENASREWTPQAIKEKVESLQKSGWDFVFIGANQDSILTAGSLGILTSNAVNYGSNKAGVKGSYMAASMGMSATRGLVSREADGGVLNAQLKAAVEQTVQNPDADLSKVATAQSSK